MPSYTCDTIANRFIAESGRFNGALYRKVAPSGPWLMGTPRAEWQDGMGKVLSNVLFERTVPSSGTNTPGTAPTLWTDQTFSDDSNVDACLPTPEILDTGQTTRPFQVQVRNLQSREFCVEDLRSDYDIVSMINALESNFKFATGYVWEDRNRNEYIRLSDHKVTETANAGFNLEATSFDPTNPPTSRLTLGTLEQIYQALIWDGAGMEGAVGRTTSTDRPVFELYTDPETSRDLIRQDPDLREDFRFAYQGMGDRAPLIMQQGSPFAYDGFRFIYDPFPERYNLVNGAFVRVPPYLTPQDTTKGKKQERNPAYKYADYQISVVHIPAVYTQRVPRPISNLGMFKFDPVKYSGDFRILNILDKKCNPRGTKLFLDAIFASASEPGLTYLGWSILHRNCQPKRHVNNSCYS